MNSLDRLKKRWNLSSTGQVWIVLIVFALTGTSVVFLRRYLKNHFEWATETWFTYLYYYLVLPFYNLLLLGYGFLFGKFRFFWEFEKKMFRKLLNLFRKKREIAS